MHLDATGTCVFERIAECFLQDAQHAEHGFRAESLQIELPVDIPDQLDIAGTQQRFDAAAEGAQGQCQIAIVLVQ